MFLYINEVILLCQDCETTRFQNSDASIIGSQTVLMQENRRVVLRSMGKGVKKGKAASRNLQALGLHKSIKECWLLS